MRSDMKISFYTFGCKVNQYETQAMRNMVEQQGHITDEYAPGDGISRDVVVFNSCTVTAESDRKLRQQLHRCRRENPNTIIVLTGCMPQAFLGNDDRLPDVDILLGNAQRNVLPQMLDSYQKSKTPLTFIPAHGTAYEPLTIATFAGRTRAYVKIQDGCNRFCSYCIIPYARGRVRSRDLDDIKQEITSLANTGYREVVLVGINLSAYGQDTGKNLADAVDVACAVEGIQRVRLGSLEPDFMTDSMLERLAKQPKLCPQFHIALQSGCNATLKRMNRHYTTEEYAELCKKLRQCFPNCALTTDVMVGFPGESVQEFHQSLTFVQQIAFSRVHVFAYSRRRGTVADKMPNQIPNATKVDRSRQMLAATHRDADDYARSYIGKTVEVLLETPLQDGITEGHTDTYLVVHAHTDQAPGTIVSVHITGGDSHHLLGKQQ